VSTILLLLNRANARCRKKQFLRRISEWGIQKNIKRDERRTILDSLGDAVKEVEFEPKTLRGRRLDKAKIARWKKREEMISGESRPGIANRSGKSTSYIR
jgi:hypothetical protein